MNYYSLFILSALLLPYRLPAQDSVKSTVKYTFEIGINPASSVSINLRSMKKIWIEDYIPGMFFKYHIKKNCIRASLNYDFYKVHAEHNIPHHYYKNDGRINRLSSSIGYERRFWNKNMIPFVFSDVSFAYTVAQGVSSFNGCWDRYLNRPYFTLRKYYFVSAGAGINYRISKRLNLLYEFSFQQGISYEKDIRAEKILTWKNRQRRPFFNPLRTLGVSYLF